MFWTALQKFAATKRVRTGNGILSVKSTETEVSTNSSKYPVALEGTPVLSSRPLYGKQCDLCILLNLAVRSKVCCISLRTFEQSTKHASQKLRYQLVNDGFLCLDTKTGALLNGMLSRKLSLLC